MAPRPALSLRTSCTRHTNLDTGMAPQGLMQIPWQGWIYAKVERHDAIPAMYVVQQGNNEAKDSVLRRQLDFDPEEEPASTSGNRTLLLRRMERKRQ